MEIKGEIKLPRECPKCKSDNVKKIIYGLFRGEPKLRDDEVLGGCVVYKDIIWQCGECRYKWGP